MDSWFGLELHVCFPLSIYIVYCYSTDNHFIKSQKHFFLSMYIICILFLLNMSFSTLLHFHSFPFFSFLSSHSSLSSSLPPSLPPTLPPSLPPSLSLSLSLSLIGYICETVIDAQEGLIKKKLYCIEVYQLMYDMTGSPEPVTGT